MLPCRECKWTKEWPGQVHWHSTYIFLCRSLVFLVPTMLPPKTISTDEPPGSQGDEGHPSSQVSCIMCVAPSSSAGLDHIVIRLGSAPLTSPSVPGLPAPHPHGNSSSSGTNVIIPGQNYKYSSWHHFHYSQVNWWNSFTSQRSWMTQNDQILSQRGRVPMQVRTRRPGCEGGMGGYDRGERAVSYRGTGWVWEITSWISRLQESYRSF